MESQNCQGELKRPKFHYEIYKQGRTQRGQAEEKNIFTIFRVSLLIILWIFGTFFGI
jgi:hypothetical protein